MATMKDIADRLGISLGTVSKGLNDGKDISDELRKTILDTAVEMGYTNRKALKLERRKIALFVENMDYEEEYSFGYDIVMGFQKASFSEKWNFSVIPLTHDFQSKNKYDNWMLQEGYSGAFFIGLSLDDPWTEQLRTTTIPSVLLDNSIEQNPAVSFVGTDSSEGIEAAIKYLASLGHEKIAFLNGSAGSVISDNRMAAYLNSMARCKLTVDPNMAVYGYFVADCAPYHVPGFIDRGATAILCGNDLIASGVIKCCNEMGLKVPEDISVIGFDDIPLASKLTPALTTIRQSRTGIGKCAYFTLYSLINGVPISRSLLRPELIIRDSVSIAKPRVAVKRENDPDSVMFVNPELYAHFSRINMM
ncbi:transcriptional regulator, LacI family [Eubacterium ruminantium]|nr:transcriptional regulator, LacI family [Eubacterium ruminantium]